MTVPHLTVKLYSPPMRGALVLRPGLMQQLNERLTAKSGVFGCKPTFTAVPSGFGNTTLACEQVNQSSGI